MTDGATPPATFQEIVQGTQGLPQEPGVYLMRDRQGVVVYVGKAVNLRARVRSYFSGTDTRAFVALLESLLGGIETIVVRTEKEALLLEATLIKKHRPRFNVIQRDDKSFITLRVDLSHPYPRVEVTRSHQVSKEGPQPHCRYFGPYSSSPAVRETLHTLNQHFLLRTCTDRAFEHRRRPCLQHQMGRCPAPCVLEVPAQDYRRQVDDAILFLSGRHDALVETLRRRMQECSNALQFEEAARARDTLRAIEKTLERQVVAEAVGGNQDVVGLARQGNAVAFSILQVRGGRVVDKDGLCLPDAEVPDQELTLQLLDARASRVAPADIPDEVLLPLSLPDDEAAARAAYLTEVRGRKVELHTPVRGDKRRLVEIATRNAETILSGHLVRQETRAQALERVQQRLRLGRRPSVMECFDVSLFQGQDPVASQVVFVDGTPQPSRYRHFLVKSVTGTDDYAMLLEVVTRRLRRGLGQGDLPDLVVIDGGKGQLNAARAAFREVGVPISATEAEHLGTLRREDGSVAWPDRARWVELRSLAKARALGDKERGWVGRGTITARTTDNDTWDEGGEEGGARHSPERVFLPDVKDPILLKPNTAELHLLAALRDEAHRFAITFHRARRKRSTLRSALDAIPGVGPARRTSLLRHLGSLAAVRRATPEELAQAPGISQEVAQRVWQAFQADRDDETE
jgi:excinuclease ABC subunit C